ncbi:DUF2797 domain-containing protein [Streptomyces sp. NPDC127068]|uniref:DUF2797 domain-containing protein n=1 Tax=Streptomyces sp. NPDC127068 TaxID=3347127 RepID=UPI0036487DD8
MTWWSTGVRWDAGAGRPVLGWRGDCGAARERALRYGEVLGFRAVGARRCAGVWRGGRWVDCAGAAVLGGRTTRAQCPECARLDRVRSVAADTYVDDPRPYRVYLAWFGDGLVKVGITRVERGSARLLEQGAVAFAWLGSGPLMAARRTEELLRAALGVPDRIPYDRKRAVRAELPAAEVRAGALRGVHRVAVGLPGWPDSLQRAAECVVVDHGGVFGLAGLPPATAVVTELRDGGVVRGTLLAAAGPDLHLLVNSSRTRTGAGRGTGVVVVDGRLMAGWELVRDDGGEGDGGAGGVVSVPVRDVSAVQGGLF